MVIKHYSTHERNERYVIREKEDKRKSEIRKPSQLIGHIKEETERETDGQRIQMNIHFYSTFLRFWTNLDKPQSYQRSCQ